MLAFYCWSPTEDSQEWNDEGGLIKASSERNAAEQFAYEKTDLDEDDEGASETIEVLVAPEAAPHRSPGRWWVEVKVKVRIETEFETTAKRHVR